MYGTTPSPIFGAAPVLPPFLPPYQGVLPENRGSDDSQSSDSSPISSSPDDDAHEQPILERASSSPEVNTPAFTGRFSWKRVGSSPAPTRAETLGNLYRKPPKEEAYRLTKVTSQDPEWGAIQKYLQQKPGFCKKYDVVSIDRVDNPTLTEQYEGKKKGLSLKVDNEALHLAWDKEQEQETRGPVYAALKKMLSPTQHKGVSSVWACHATRNQYLKPVLKSGLDFIGKTDSGIFAQGTYLTTYPDYGVGNYGGGDNVFLLCEVALREKNVYPVASCDDLVGKSMRPGSDMHYAEVVPERPGSHMYISRKPFEKGIYDELVVRDSSQILIKYVIRVAPKAGVLEVKATATRRDLKEAIINYLTQNPSTDQFAQLNQKLLELKDPLAKQLNSQEFELFVMLERSLGEKNASMKAVLEEKVNKFFVAEQFQELVLPATPHLLVKSKSIRDNGEANLTQGESFLKAGDGKKALAEFQKVLRLAPHSLPALLGCAAAFALEKSFNETIDHYNAAIKIDAKNAVARTKCADALVDRAVSFAKAVDYPNAIKDLTQALVHDSKHVRALGVLASTYYAQRDFDQAFVYCGRALTINKNCEPALRVRGAIFSEKGMNDKALADLGQAIQIKPSIFSYLKRAVILLSLNRLDEAAKDCAETLKLDPENPNAQAIQAKVHLAKNEPAPAEKLLKTSFKRDPDNLFVLSALGDFYLKKKDPKKALQHLDRFVEVYKGLQTQEKIGEKDKSLLYQVLLSIAQGHILLNAHDQAFAIYQKAIALSPGSKKAYEDRGNLYRLKGDKEKALLDFNHALTL